MALSKNLLTVETLNEKIEQDATISDDGTISNYVPAESPLAEVFQPVTLQSSSSTLPIAVAVVAIVGGVTLTIMKKAKKKKEETDV